MPIFGSAKSDDKTKLKGALGKFRAGVKKLWPGRGMDAGAIDDLEAALLKSDVSLETVEKLLEPLRSKEADADGPGYLREQIKNIFAAAGNPDLQKSSVPPSVYFFVGVNGSGKTTSMAKLAHKLDGEILFAAADTFRAAAIEQLQEWGERLEIDVIAHQKGGDPSAVVYDAIEAACGRGVDYLFVDTAGRLHTRGDLMEQLNKMYRVAAGQKSGEPAETLLVLDASTGQNGVKQVEKYAEQLPVSGIILSKLDSTARGGVVLSAADKFQVPVKFVGTGETLDDLAPFSPDIYCDALLAENFAGGEE